MSRFVNTKKEFSSCHKSKNSNYFSQTYNLQWVWPIHMAFTWNKVSRTQLFHLWHTFHVLVWAGVYHSQWIFYFIFVQGHPNWPKSPNVHKAKVKQAGTIKHHCASEVEVTPTMMGVSQPGIRWLGEVRVPVFGGGDCNRSGLYLIFYTYGWYLWWDDIVCHIPDSQAQVRSVGQGDALHLGRDRAEDCIRVLVAFVQHTDIPA